MIDDEADLDRLVVQSPAHVARTYSVIMAASRLVREGPSVDHLRRYVSQITESNQPVNWSDWYRHVGGCANRILEHRGEPIQVAEFSDMINKKHRAYGARPLRQWGNLGLAIRLDSKVSRYHTLTVQGRDIEEEPARDSLIDIVGYCILGLMMEGEKK